MERYKWIDTFLKILSFLRPKFYNRLTWWVVGIGLGLVGAIPILERILIAIIDKQFSLTIPPDLSNTIGLILVLSGLIYNILMKIVDNSYELGLASKNSPVLQSDINVYNRIMKTIPYHEVDSFAHYDFMGSFRWENYRNIEKYMEGSKSPEISFFNDELKTLKEEFDHSLENFWHALTRFTFHVKGTNEVYRVPSEWERTMPEKYDLAKKEIYKYQDQFLECYNSLIEGCRRKLGI